MQARIVEKEQIWYAQTENGRINFMFVRYEIGKWVRFRLFGMVNWNENIPLHPSSSEGTNMLPFDITENSLKITWIRVNPENRGKWLSDILFLQALKIADILNIRNIETSVIRKPILAKKLNEWGFIPNEATTYAHIIPDNDSSSALPLVDIYSEKDKFKPTNISRTWKHLFYDVRDVYIWRPPSHIVVRDCPVIEERYAINDLNQIDYSRLSESIVWKNPMYKSRVLKVFSNI
jgi:hypothetical protein